MKTPLVSDLNSEQNITTFFLVCEKEIRSTREGKPYLRLELGDRSGTIEARMWDQFEAAAKGIQREDFVKVQARVEIFKNRPQLSVIQAHLDHRKLRPVLIDFDARLDFHEIFSLNALCRRFELVPHTRFDGPAAVAKLQAQIRLSFARTANFFFANEEKCCDVLLGIQVRDERSLHRTVF